ncbi:MAG: ribosomal protein L11, partial [Candidatus Latescibacterota bacterium]
MKTITYLLLMLFTAVGFAQNAPIDFEAGGNGASWTWTVFENNTNPPLNVIANPDPTGVNTTATVAEFTALQAGNPWAGVESLHGADIGTFTLDATNALLKIWVWKPVVSNVGIKFSTASGASTGEILVANTLTNQWEELIFDFSSKIGEPTSTDIDQIVVFPDFDARAMDNVIYFDNITFEALPAPMNLPFDFEGIAPAFADFNGSFTQVIANPDVTGVNTSANVAENTIPGGVAFAGVNIPVAIDITIDKFFRMDVWSPLAGTPVLLKLEGGGNPPIERQATLTTTGAWEEIVFDFSTEGALTYTSVTLFMNFNVIDPATQIYYWDNLEQYGPVAGLPFTFEGTLPTFGDFNGSFTQVIANPDVSGVNMSANVAENTIPGGVAFAGVNIPVTYDIITNKYFNMDVWSPLAGTPVLLKLEGGPNPPIERQAVLTTTGAWETIEFDFSAEGALAYESVTIFMNFNVIDGASQTYYWDNLIQTSGPSAPFVPIDFEVGGNGATWTWTVFENASNPPLNIIANPDPTGANTSATVAEFTALQAGNPWAGVESLHGADIGTFTLDASNAIVKIMVWKPVISNVGIKFATLSGASTGEILVPNTLVNQWEELTFDFSGIIGAPSSTDIDQIVVFPDFDSRTMDNVVYFDNISFSSSVPVVTMLPLDFEGVAPVFGDFNGSLTQVIANPDATGVNTSANVAENTIPGGAAFAGVNIPVTYDIITDKYFRMDVWSPLAGTPVLLKLEGGPNPPIERQAVLTTTGAWEEILFDFSSEGPLAYESVTVFMNFNVVDGADQTYYWDNLEQFTPVASLPFTFEGFLPTFGDFNGSATQVIANPDATGVNASANVAENTIPGGAAFAGVNIPVTYDIITDKYFRMDVWSPLAGMPVLLKLEGGPNPPIERQAVLTTNGAWEEVVFDFSSEGPLAYESVTIFMNFNMVDGANQTYYWDNLEQFTLLTDDTCAGATPMACGDVVTGDTTTNTDTGGFNGAPDVWYSYTGTGAQEFVTFSLCDGGTSYDSRLTVYDMCGAVELATNDDFCGLQSQLGFLS